ncbi:MAG: molecular chaperone HtpG [Ignavibacteria bacterium]|nr:molecular chaperone HtpG [Ignavibacteria bacterium]
MEEIKQQKAQEFEYKAEMKQLLNLIINSLYTQQEIFLRELVSNSSDALNKVRFRRLSDSNFLDADVPLKIWIEVDKDKELFSIEDSGVGMSKDDLINQLGTIASSGTLEVLQQIRQRQQSFDGNLIGQFGVGFYSVFMVTDEITVDTRYIENDSIGLRWKSIGEDKFSIEEIEKKERGTKIYFKLKEDFKEYYEPERIKIILQKYSNFVDFPIFLNGEEINKVSAIWHKKKDDVKEDELNEFYKFISNDFQDPLAHIHLSIEGNVNFKSLLFIPQSAPPMLFKDVHEKSVQLYSSKIFIQDDCKELLPEYLRFLRGLVDTEDLPLNVSRELTQNSPVLAKIKNVITSKTLAHLEEIAENDKGKYEKFFKNFGSLFKLGVNSDWSNKEKITNLLRFESSALPKGEITSFKEYISRMKAEQKEIFYLTGDSREKVEQNPNLEYFKKNELEVLYLSDPVDVFTIPYISEFDGKELKSADKVDIKVSKEEETRLDSLTEDSSKSLIELFKDVLKDKVEDVLVSKRLVESPVTLVVGKEGLDAQMEKMMQYLDKEFTASKRILEINTTHPLIKNLAKMHIANDKNELLRSSITQLYEGALLIDGYLKNPNEFVKRTFDFMEKATV